MISHQEFEEYKEIEEEESGEDFFILNSKNNS